MKPPSKDKAKGSDLKRKMDSIKARIPKKARKGWTNKHCSLCKKHGGMHTMHNTKECSFYNNDGTQNKSARKPKANKPSREKIGQNYAQIFHQECKKAVHSAFKQTKRGSKHCHH